MFNAIRQPIVPVVRRSAAPVAQQRNMANLKEIKIRMASVKNIQKITASMKLVAAARMKSAQTSMERSRPFWNAANAPFEAKFKAPNADNLRLDRKKKNLLIVLTSDRGLCGAINSSLVRKARELIRDVPDCQVVVVGEKGKAGLVREFSKNFAFTAADVGKKKLNFVDVATIAEELFALEFEEATILSNKFVSVLTFETLVRQMKNKEHLQNEVDFSDYEFEDEKPAALENLFQFHMGAMLYSALTENAAAELAARMTSMDNASRNATDVFDRLEISYNRQRQANITTELTEIIAGVEAIQ